MTSIRIIKASRSPNFRDLETLSQGLHTDWFGAPLTPPVRLLFWISEERLHFLIQAPMGPGLSHPEGQPSQYHAELWNYDVAEFFIADPNSGRYLEFNLAPNGAWWSCGFSAPRQASPGEPSALPNVETRTHQVSDSWFAQASLPLPWLREHYHFGASSKMNACFILGSPRQVFVTAAPPPPNEDAPDFHRPEKFLSGEFISLA